jgi:hypothetical protein
MINVSITLINSGQCVQQLCGLQKLEQMLFALSAALDQVPDILRVWDLVHMVLIEGMAWGEWDVGLLGLQW